MDQCSNCEEKISDEVFKKGVCAKCGTEIVYGSNGCGG